jgi:hypothetical protein
MTAGVTIQAYHTDNGVFTSKEFMRELAEKGQGMTLSGVSAQFQNGAAENAIKIVVRNARTMMIHATLRWPGFVEKDLWPMALSHAAYLFNITPNMETGVSPISVWTRTTQESNALRNTHTWGCPVYVLTPKLKDGQKIPKWDWCAICSPVPSHRNSTSSMMTTSKRFTLVKTKSRRIGVSYYDLVASNQVMTKMTTYRIYQTNG